jgi:hypothetical protein
LVVFSLVKKFSLLTKMSKEVNYHYQESFYPHHRRRFARGGGMGYSPPRPIFVPKEYNYPPLFSFGTNIEQPIYYDPVPRPQEVIVVDPNTNMKATDDTTTQDGSTQNSIIQEQNKLSFTNIALHVGIAVLILAGLWYLLSGRKKKE